MQPLWSLARTMIHGPTMPVVELHKRIDEIASRAALVFGEDPEIFAAEEHASTGCSVCARALVNARDVSAGLAFLSPSWSAPPPGVREKILERARVPGRTSDSPPPPRASVPPAVSSREPRVFDPSATVAHLHLTGPDEAERAREVEDLAAHLQPQGTPGGDPTERVLVQIERILGFPLHFVSVIRGDRVGYRVQRGLSTDLRGFGGMRREMTFCTHCVSSGEPLIVKNAGAEPFFRGNPAVSRHRIRAYVGVPLRTSKGIVVGTLCALDYRPRAVSPDVVRVLELFARRVVAEIERPRDSTLLDALVLDPPRGAIYQRGWFDELLSIERTRTSSEGRHAALVVARGCSRADLPSVAPLLRDDEVAGEIDDGAVGILLSGAGAEQAKARCEALSAANTKISFTFAPADPAIATSAAWIDAARTGLPV